MPFDDDTAFQRAILADPADTTLKLVDADWLQERDDPRAQFVRLQVEPHAAGGTAAAVEAAAWVVREGGRRAEWVALFRRSFASA